MSARVDERIAGSVLTEAVSWRHYLHRHPELAYNENQTADFVAARLDQFGLRVHRGLGGTGVVGTLTRGRAGRSIGIRADMDALRVQEISSLPYTSSSPGVMHACGHDGHVAIALTAARVCAALDRLNGTVHFIFQPAEEGGAGAQRMIDDGLFDLFPCDAIYAFHNWPALPLGACVVRDGAMLASNAVIDIEITGKGCHGAMPHEGTDAVLAGCHVVVAIQSIVSRSMDPLGHAVVSATQIRAGDTHNVIPDQCHIRGTARWFDSAVGDKIEQRINQLSVATAAAFGCQANVGFERRYPATVNDPARAKFLRSVVTDLCPRLNLVDAPPSMGAEDFAFMLRRVPGCYFWLGTGKAEATPGLHSPRYDFNDDLVPLAVELWVSLVRASLA